MQECLEFKAWFGVAVGFKVQAEGPGFKVKWECEGL